MKVGLFFGSFNPVHIGHLAIANYITEFTDIEQIWLVISPQNPFKKKSSLLADYHRYELIYRAIADCQKIKASKVEFSMPKPSYTIDTLTYLHEKYPQNDFVLIMGADCLPTFDKWKNHEKILEYYSVYVYPRIGNYDCEMQQHPKVKLISGCPNIEVSASFIRQAIKEQKNIQFFVPAATYSYMREMHFYEK